MLRRIAETVLAVFVTLVLTLGCRMTLTENAVAAKLPELDSEQVDQLQQAVSELLNGRSVTLANNAFESTDKLLIERVVKNDERGLPIEGRRTDNAIVFSLLMADGVCWVRRDDTNASVPLADMPCRPLGG